MAPAALGAKRRCLSCAAPFYDLNRSPIVCPKCGASFMVVELPRNPPGMRQRMPTFTPVPRAEPLEAEEAVAEEKTNEEDDIPEIEEDDETGIEQIDDLKPHDSERNA